MSYIDIDEIFSTYSLELDGHFDTIRPRPIKDLSIFQQQCIRNNLGMPLRIAQRLDDTSLSFKVRLGNCPGCGNSILGEMNPDTRRITYAESTGYDGVRATTLHESCRYPAPSPFRSQLQVPSEELVIANDLRPLVEPSHQLRNAKESAFCLAQRGSISPMMETSRDGERLHHEFWRQQGLFYIPASNTNIIVAQEPGNGQLFFSLMDRIHPDHQVIGDITTDLWAVTAMDRCLFDSYCKAQDLDPDAALAHYSAITLKVPRGNYEGTLLCDSLRDLGEPLLMAVLSLSADGQAE